MGGESMDDILRRAQRELACPVCRRHFSLEEIRVRGAFEQAYLVQTACHRGHTPTLVLYIVTTGPTRVRLEHSITTDDVLDLHQGLKQFKGDFRSVFETLGGSPKR